MPDTPLVAAIIGGGACGLFAAAQLGRRLAGSAQSARVIVLEKLPRVGKKLLATGNGKCNLTNIYATTSGYYGDRLFAREVVKQFSVEETLKRFTDMGLLWKQEAQGRVYPDCEQAAGVLEVLRLECQRWGVEFWTESPVTAVEKKGQSFLLTTPQNVMRADVVLLCTGGKAAPALGSDGSGYALAEKLGHTVTPVFPALVQLRSSSKIPKKLKGVRKKCAVHLRMNGKDMPGIKGEILFTDYGLSGIAVMELSRAVGQANEGGKPCSMQAVLDLLPDMTAAGLDDWLTNRREALFGYPAAELLTGLVHMKLCTVLLREAGIPLDKPIERLSSRELQQLVAILKGWAFPVEGTNGFPNAQVTAGGIDTAQINPQTMESRVCGGLFLGGELLNVDGACGGYNLQWAWSTAQAAAEGMTVKITERAGKRHA